MKKINKSFSIKLPPIRLYLDDLAQIADILGPSSSPVLISTSDYEFANVSELKSLKVDQINTLKISIREPHIWVSLEPSEARLYAANDDAMSRGLLEQVKQVFMARKRPFHRLRRTVFCLGL